jgi:hypothetical protein
MNGNLETTNLLLGIMAGVSVLEALLILGLGFAAWKLYARVTELTESIESRYVQPTMTKVNTLIDEVQGIAASVRTNQEKVERAIRHTVDRVDDTAHRLKGEVRAKTSWIVGTIRGIRVAVHDILQAAQTHEREPLDHPTSTRTH